MSDPTLSDIDFKNKMALALNKSVLFVCIWWLVSSPIFPHRENQGILFI